MDLTRTDLSAQHEALATKKISARELAGEYLKKIEALDPELKAYITVTGEKALVDADRAQALLDKGEAGALCGIPAALKDNFCVDGVRTTCASKMLENFVPPYTSTAVERLEEAGYVLLGKASLDEFAMGATNQSSAFAKTVNPYDKTRVPGGSSGGSAAAVSAGLCGFALGTDTGGSLRQPSAFCGVTGLKPTYGRVSRYGVVAFASSLDQVGPIGRSARDCALVLNTICGHDPKDPTSSKRAVPDFTAKIGADVRGLRIAMPKEFFGDAVDDEVKAAVLAAARFYEKKGATIVEASMKSLKYAVSAYYLIASAEAASNMARFDGIKYGLAGEGRTYEEKIRDSRGRGFGDEVKRRILLGNYALSSGYYDAYYVKALALKQEVRREYAAIFDTADVLLTPTTPSKAYKIGERDYDPVKMYSADICTATVNIAGLPAISTTCGYSADGLPLGMSITGRSFDEETIIQAADCYEREFEKRAPTALGQGGQV